MMNLLQYFEQQNEMYGLDVAYEEQKQLYMLMQDDDQHDFEEWCEVHDNIDMTAMADDGFSYVEHWAWDMEEVMDC